MQIPLSVYRRRIQRQIPQIKSERGVAILEFTLCSFALLLVTGGLFDFGRAFYADHLIQNTARETARQAVTIQEISSPTTEAITSKVEENFIAPKLLNNLNAQIEGPANYSDGSDQLMLKVTLEGDIKFLFLTLLGMDAIHLKRSTLVRYEWQPAPSV